MRMLKRLVGRIFQTLTGRIIVSPQNVGLKFEQIQLARIFRGLDVDCVFDVGANEGQYARMLRQEIGYTGAIVSFEPSPAAAEALRRQAANDDNWYVEELALDTQAGSATFNEMADSQFSSLLSPSAFSDVLFTAKNSVVRQVQVRTSTLSAQVALYKAKLGFKRAFLKMDTQGHDLAVAAGAGASLAVFVGLQSELSVKPIYQGAPLLLDAIDFYLRRGFEISAFVPNNTGHFPFLVEIDCILLRADVMQMLAGLT